MNSGCTILVPFKLDFRPSGCISIGDLIKIGAVGNLQSTISVITPSCVFRAEYDSTRRNGDVMAKQLHKGVLNGKVFALFEKYFIVEVLFEDERFHLCN